MYTTYSLITPGRNATYGIIIIYKMKVVMVLCRLRPQGPNYAVNKSSLNGQPVGPSGQGPVPLLGMIAMAIALPPPTVHEVRLEPDMFVTRVAFDFRIIHCEPRFVSFYPFIIFFFQRLVV